MISREEVEQIVNQMIDQKIEPLTEEIAALKAQLGKVDLLAIDSRNIRQSSERIETAQNSLKLDFERQEKRIVRFEKQTNDQLTNLKEDTTTIKENITTINGKVVGLQTEMRQRFTTVETQLTEHKTLLTEILARLPKL
jgi:chromosome segregation ATPase